MQIALGTEIAKLRGDGLIGFRLVFVRYVFAAQAQGFIDQPHPDAALVVRIGPA
ncbi:hypothetical protein D3C85_1866470 [compost metagenome]